MGFFSTYNWVDIPSSRKLMWEILETAMENWRIWNVTYVTICFFLASDRKQNRSLIFSLVFFAEQPKHLPNQRKSKLQIDIWSFSEILRRRDGGFWVGNSVNCSSLWVPMDRPLLRSAPWPFGASDAAVEVKKTKKSKKPKASAVQRQQQLPGRTAIARYCKR